MYMFLYEKIWLISVRDWIIIRVIIINIRVISEIADHTTDSETWEPSQCEDVILAISRVSCEKGPTRHAYAWQIGPFWQDTLDIRIPMIKIQQYHDRPIFIMGIPIPGKMVFTLNQAEKILYKVLMNW